MTCPYYLNKYKNDYTFKLARAESARYCNERGESFFINLKLEDGMSQGFGGYQLSEYNEKLKRDIPSASGLDMINQLNRLFGVYNLNEINSTYIYAAYRNTGDTYCIAGIAKLQMNISYEKNAVNYFLVDEWRNDWFGDF